jgi:arylsulfatase A-like enzyme
LLQGTATDWRQSAFIEFFTYENPFPWLLDMDYRAIRTERYKYIHWMQHPDENELYDLEKDPYETTNLIDDPQLAGIVGHLRAEMAAAVLDVMGLAK